MGGLAQEVRRLFGSKTSDLQQLQKDPPANPFGAMSAFGAKTQEIATEIALPKPIQDWFEGMDIITCEDIGLMATVEAEVKTNITAVLDQAGVADVKLPGNKIKLTKFWTRCREVYEAEKARNKAVKSGQRDAETEIPEEDFADITTKWFARHSFVLPDAQLLVPSQQVKMWRDAQLNPRQVGLWLAEALRTKACIHKRSGTGMTVPEAGPVTAHRVIADEVERSFELWLRARAFLMTLSFVTVVLDEGWFPLQSAILVSEQILTYVTDTYNNQSPPLSFLVNAWASTSQYWSQQIRVNVQTPKNVMGAIGAWEHKWKWTPAADTDNASSGSQGVGTARVGPREPDNKALKNEVDSLKGQVRRFQSAADHMLNNSNTRNDAPWNQSEDREPKRARGNGGGKPARGNDGGGGKGKKGGNGGGGGKNAGFARRQRR